MDRSLSALVQRQQHSIAKLEGRFDQFPLRSAPVAAGFERAGHDLDVMFAESIQSQTLVARINPPVSSYLRNSVVRRPLRHIGVKAFPVLHHWREQPQFAAL